MVRLIESADLERLAELEVMLFDNPMPASMLAREVAAPHGVGWVIGEPVRAYALGRIDGRAFDLTRLAVAPEHQRQGLGHLLLQYATARHPWIVLTVLKNNTGALKLYKSFGFRIVGHLSVESAWVLERRHDTAGPQPASRSSA